MVTNFLDILNFVGQAEGVETYFSLAQIFLDRPTDRQTDRQTDGQTDKNIRAPCTHADPNSMKIIQLKKIILNFVKLMHKISCLNIIVTTTEGHTIMIIFPGVVKKGPCTYRAKRYFSMLA